VHDDVHIFRQQQIDAGQFPFNDHIQQPVQKLGLIHLAVQNPLDPAQPHGRVTQRDPAAIHRDAQARGLRSQGGRPLAEAGDLRRSRGRQQVPQAGQVIHRFDQGLPQPRQVEVVE